MTRSNMSVILQDSVSNQAFKTWLFGRAYL